MEMSRRYIESVVFLLDSTRKDMLVYLSSKVTFLWVISDEVGSREY